MMKNKINKKVTLFFLSLCVLMPNLPAQDDDYFVPEMNLEQMTETGEFWYSFYIGAFKVGYAQQIEERVEIDGVTYLQARVNGRMFLQKQGVDQYSEFTEVMRFSLEEPYHLVFAEKIDQMADERNVTRLLQTEGGWLHTVEDGHGLREIPHSGFTFTLADAWADGVWANDPNRKVGDTAKTRDFDIESDKLLTQEITYLGRTQRVINGVKVDVVQIELRNPETKSTMFVDFDADGHLLNMRMTGFEMRAVLKEDALAAANILNVDHVGIKKLNRRIGEPNHLQRLKLSVEDKGYLELVNTAEQVVSKGQNDSVILELGPGVGEALVATPEELKQSIKETSRYPIKMEAIQKMAQEATAGAASISEKVDALVHFVSDFIKDSYSADSLTVSEIIRRQEGDCSEHAMLMVTLARALEIPAREVAGLIYIGDEVQEFGPHVWVEVAIDGKWRAVDPSWDERVLNPTHIRLGVDGELPENFDLILKPSTFDVVAIEYKEGMSPAEPQSADGLVTLGIGKYGATFKAKDGWVAEKFLNELDTDQYRKGVSYFVMAFERMGAVETEAQFQFVVDRMRDMGPGNNELEGVSIQQKGDLYHGTLHTTTTIDSRELAYRCDTFSKNGLTYQLILWTSIDNKEGLAAEADVIAANFHFPADAAFPDSNSELTAALDGGAAKVELRFREQDFMQLTGDRFDDQIFLASTQHEVTFFARFDDWVFENDAVAYHDLLLESIESDEATYIVEQQAMDVLGYNGYLVVTKSMIGKKMMYIYHVIVPIAESEIISLRLLAAEGSEALGWQMGQSLISRMTFVPKEGFGPPKLQAGQLLAEPPTVSELYADYQQAATPLFQLPVVTNVIAVGDHFVASVDGKVMFANSDGQHKVLYGFADTVLTLSAAQMGEQWVIVTDQGSLVYNGKDASAVEKPFSAIFPNDGLTALVAAGFDDPMAQILSDNAAHTLRYYDGKLGRELASWTAAVYQMGADLSGSHVLVTHTPEWYQRGESAYYPSFRVDLATGKKQPLQLNWHSLVSIQPAEGGWVVLGQPEKGIYGVYFIDLAGNDDLLLPGNQFTPIKIEKGQLTLAVSNEEVTQLYLLEVEKARNLTKANAFLNPNLYGELGRMVFTKLGWSLAQPGLLARKQDLLIFLDAAEGLAQEMSPNPMPSDVETLHLIFMYGYYANITWDVEGEILLTALLMREFFKGGALWVDSDVSLITAMAKRMPDRYSSPFHMGYVASSIAENTLYEADGYWEPIDEVRDSTYGRKLVFATDYQVLRSYILEREPSNLWEMAQENPGAFSKLMLSNKDNRFFFFSFGQTCFQSGKVDILKQVLKDLERQGETSLMQTYFQILVDVDSGRVKPKKLVEQIEAFLDAQPDNLLMTYLLGQTLVRQGDAASKEAARVQFSSVAESDSASESLRKLAAQALAKL